jgi:predicted nuclease with TOPRIM domain
VEDAIIGTLQNRITQLEQECATLRAEAKDRRIKGKALREENERIVEAYKQLETERDEYKTAFETEPSELQAQVEEYRGKLRDRDHRDKFKELATAAGVTAPKAIEDLYQLSGYKPEKDEIDEQTIQAAIGSTLQGRDWLKSPTTAAGAANGQPAGSGTRTGQAPGQATPQPPLQPGPGASRGGASVRDDSEAVLEAKYPNAFRLA